MNRPARLCRLNRVKRPSRNGFGTSISQANHIIAETSSSPQNRQPWRRPASWVGLPGRVSPPIGALPAAAMEHGHPDPRATVDMNRGAGYRTCAGLQVATAGETTASTRPGQVAVHQSAPAQARSSRANLVRPAKLTLGMSGRLYRYRDRPVVDPIRAATR